jgi:hypothetical protein
MGTISDSVVEILKTQARGKVLLPDDPDYEDARSIWNAMIVTAGLPG